MSENENRFVTTSNVKVSWTKDLLAGKDEWMADMERVGWVG